MKLPVSRRNRELKVYSKKKKEYIHRHTRMHVGMYDCMRSESESELGNPQSGILRKTNKETCMLVSLCV